MMWTTLTCVLVGAWLAHRLMALVTPPDRIEPMTPAWRGAYYRREQQNANLKETR